MKLLVFAHTPPPHHGQSYMVKLMLDGFADPQHGVECYHVNARFSRELADVGEFQGGKIFLVFWFCAVAIWIRFRHGVKNFYYVPAPSKRVALYRDWLVMLLCRPFFEKVILHWHAAGLGKWLETSNPIFARAATYRLFKPVDLSIVISRYNVADAEKLLSRNIHVVNNGIPDPCPDFAEMVLPRRQERFARRREIFTGKCTGEPATVNLLFLAHCTREKGVFAAIEAVRQAARELAARGLPLKLKLTIAGNFITDEERAEFDGLQQNPEIAALVHYAGFVSGEQKERLYREADLFLFPTCYLGENQPVNLIEAMAFGLPIITTRWRSLPEMLPPAYPGLVDTQSPKQVADALIRLMSEHSGEWARQNFSTRFTLANHLTALAAALRSVKE
jgi:glycosyltransferase involved in cell wall biosynthesis